MKTISTQECRATTDSQACTGQGATHAYIEDAGKVSRSVS
jgi:hypothetical protein